MVGHSCSESARWEVFAPTGARQPLESIFSVFLAALNLAVIGNVMGHANVHTDCHLISCYASLYPASGEPTLPFVVCRSASRLRRNYCDAAAHHSTHNTQHHTCTYQHQQLAHKQSNAPQNQSHQSQHGEGRRRRFAWRPCPGCRLTGCTSQRFRAVGTAQPQTYLLEDRDEGRAEQEGRVESPQPSVVHVGVSYLREPRSCCPRSLALLHLQEALTNLEQLQAVMMPG